MLLPVVVALASLLYMESVRRSIGHLRSKGKAIGVLRFLVVDDTTGQPTQGVGVELVMLHPGWRKRPDQVKGFDPSPLKLKTDRDGRTRFGLGAATVVPLEYKFHGLIPVAGSPEVVYHRNLGVRASAAGYETWVRPLDDIARENGRDINQFGLMDVLIRLRRVSSEPPLP
jgi:hypothetical protein